VRALPSFAVLPARSGNKLATPRPSATVLSAGAVNRQTGNQTEGSSILQFLLMDSDEEQVVAIENQPGEVFPGQLGRPGRQTKRSFAACSNIACDRHSIQKGLHLAVQSGPRHFQCDRAFGLRDNLRKRL